jgi:hypothetical protein
MTQASSRPAAMKSLREAVRLWFDSCIERGVLDKALKEAGFQKAGSRYTARKNASVVEVAQSTPNSPVFSTRDYIEVSMPAYIAAQYLGSSAAR